MVPKGALLDLLRVGGRDDPLRHERVHGEAYLSNTYNPINTRTYTNIHN